jgi:hypothetical protein
MPSRTVFTDGSNTAVTLSVNEVFGHRITTIIDINGATLATIQGNFNDHLLGTNVGLAGATVDVTTTSLKVTPSANSQIDYVLKGAGADAQDSDLLAFGTDPVVTHLMTYIML